MTEPFYLIVSTDDESVCQVSGDRFFDDTILFQSLRRDWRRDKVRVFAIVEGEVEEIDSWTDNDIGYEKVYELKD